MNSAEVLIKFKADTSDVDRTTKSMGGLTKSITLGNLAAKGIAKGLQVMSSQMGSAIKRVDTFNNFPRVMKNFGVSNDEAKKSIDRMDKAMRGLPTSLDQAVAGVQDLFLVTKNLPEAEKMFKAINDSAMVFAKGSTEAVDRFVYAFKQSMAAGKVSAQDFKQMSDAIPGLMDKVAESMGISFAELKEGLSNGKISMDEFNNAMKKLDTEGGAGMKALEKSARDATGGIETAITNMKTAITRGLGNALDALDKSLKDAGLGGLSGVIASIGDAFEKVLKAIVPLIPKIIELVKWVVKNKDTLILISKILIPLIATIKIYNTYIGIKNKLAMMSANGDLKMIKSMVSLTKSIITSTAALVKNIAQWVVSKTVMLAQAVATKAVAAAQWLLNAAMNANPIGLIIIAVAALIAIFVILWKKSEGFRNFWLNAWETIKNAVITAWNFIKGVFTTIIDFVKNNWKQILLFLVNPFAGAFALLYKHNEKFRNAINNLVNSVVGFFKSIPGKIKAIPGKMVSFFKSLPSKILNIFKSLPGKIKNVGLNIVKGIGKGITSGTTWIKNKIKEFTNNVKNSLKSFFGIKSPSKWANEVIGQNISKGIANGLKAKKINWKNIGKQLGEQLKSGMNDAVGSVKSIADTLKSNLSKIDLMSDGKLTDLSSIKDQVIQYGKNLSRLKGKIPADLYTEVLGMSREEGLDYTNQLLALSNNELSNYVKNYQAIQKESQKVSDAYYNEEVKKIKTQYTDKILGQLKTIQKNSKKLGKNATKGLINGMLSEIKGLDSASKQVANSIIKSIKKTLKIKSPSRVMEQMGEYTTEGFINGITSMQSELNKVMSSSFDLSPNVVNSTSTHFSPNINVNVENNMTTDPLGQVVNKVKTFSGGAKNDYNYGR